MEHVRLGRTGLKVSRLCIGTMPFGHQIDEAASIEILDRAAEAGITFIDTADIYPLGGGIDLAGTTESIVGRWLKGRRHNFVIATKANGPMGPQPWNSGNSRKHLMDAIDESLRRLGTDYVDLYQLHMSDEETPIDETLLAMNDMIRSGKVRYIGCSNFLAWRLARAIGRSEALGIARFESTQPRHNLLFRENERELFPLCLEEDIAVIPYNPLAGGLLTGKHDLKRPPAEGTRFTIPGAGGMYQDRYWKEREFDTVAEFTRLAAEAGIKPTTLAIAWVLSNPVITAPIIGATRANQLDDNLDALDVKLDAELARRLDDLTREYRRGDAPR